MLIKYVAEAIKKQDILSLYKSFYKQEETFCEEVKKVVEMYTFLDVECEEFDDKFLCQSTVRGQKEKEKQKEKQQEKQQQKAFNPNVEKKLEIENRAQNNQETEDVKEIVEFWDLNGFGTTNIVGRRSCYLA